MDDSGYGAVDRGLLNRSVVEQGPDEYLAAVVATIDVHPEVSIGVTLLVGGLLVSGQIESGEAWFEHHREDLESRQPGFGAIFESEIERYAEERSRAESTPVENRTDEERDRVIVSYVHLRDVTILAADGSPLSDQPTRWRCRLAAIDGWRFGPISAHRDA
jgi:hypothetical protein